MLPDSRKEGYDSLIMCCPMQMCCTVVEGAFM